MFLRRVGSISMRVENFQLWETLLGGSPCIIFWHIEMIIAESPSTMIFWKPLRFAILKPSTRVESSTPLLVSCPRLGAKRWRMSLDELWNTSLPPAEYFAASCRTRVPSRQVVEVYLNEGYWRCFPGGRTMVEDSTYRYIKWNEHCEILTIPYSLLLVITFEVFTCPFREINGFLNVGVYFKPDCFY